MSNNIQVFDNNDFGKVRAFLDESGEPAFVAKDVCKILDLGNPRSSLALLDEDEKGVHSVDTPGGAQNMTTVTEPGFYKLVMRSRKPEAKAFQRWVTHEVLPALRKTGAYKAPATREERIVAALTECNGIIVELRDENQALRDANAKLSKKADLYDNWVDDVDGLISVTRCAKLLRSIDKAMTRKKLFACLRGSGYVEQKTLSCTAAAIEAGYMRERMCKFVGRDGHERFKTYGALTAKGVGMCAARFCNQPQLPELGE